MSPDRVGSGRNMFRYVLDELLVERRKRCSSFAWCALLCSARPARKRRTGSVHPGLKTFSWANTYARCPHVGPDLKPYGVLKLCLYLIGTGLYRMLDTDFGEHLY
jgi:hypothetical protein